MPPSAPTECPIRAYAEAVVSGEIVAGRLVRKACARHLRDLEEGPARGLRWDPVAAGRALAFFAHLRLPDVEGPFALQPWQEFVVGSLFGWLGADGFRRFRTAYIEAGKGCGKALALDTPIPTPSGWTTMGEIRPGDLVFDETGAACNVLAVSEVMTGHPCYRVRFSDGAEIIADAEHLWRVSSLRTGGARGPKSPDAPRKGGYAIRTTAEIAATLRVPPSASTHPQGIWNHRVDVAGALQLPDAVLPIDSYVLGVWLGDGDSDGARFTSCDEDGEIVGHLEAAGVSAVASRRDPRSRAVRRRLQKPPDGRCRRGHPLAENANDKGRCLACERETDYARRHGLPVPPESNVTIQEELRRLGLLNNKHIPPAYLRASERQRMALLQGLMDTDGYADKTGACEYTTTSDQLRDGFLELARSLGYKPTLDEDRAMLDGCDCGPKYRIKIHAYADRPAFRLSRKAARLKPQPATRPLSRGRMIVGCDPVPSVPVRCIAVDSPSHIYLAGLGMVPTHNTPLVAGIGLYGLLADGERGAQIYSAATTQDQAGLSFRDAKAIAEASPSLARRLEIGQYNIAHMPSGSFFRPVSSEHRGLDGKRVHMALIDEVHEHPTPLVVNKMRAGTKGRTQALIVEITNSGYDRTTICWQHHEFSEQVLEGIVENDSWFAYVCQLDPCEACRAEGKTTPTDGCPDCDDWHDEAVWPKANPSLPAIPGLKYLREQVAEAVGMPATESIVKRLNFCMWVEAAVHAIPMDRWDANTRTVDMESLAGRPCFGGLDIGATSDFTAFVREFPHDDAEEIELPPDPDNPNLKLFVTRRSYTLVPTFWLPERPRRRPPQVQQVIDAWVRKGLVRVTPGEVVDYDRVIEDILAMHRETPLLKIGVDRGFQGSWMCTQLIGHFGSAAVVEVPQGIVSMNAPFREFIELTVRGRLFHTGCPVMRWMASNCAAEVRGGLMKPSKDHSAEKIDGITAGCMALAVAMSQVVTRCYYDDNDVEMM